jgi:hypothetical protein
MARYKPYDYDQLMMVPISLEDQLMPGTLEYAIHHVVEERLDLSIFDERYSNDETGRKAIAPEVLIKIVLFGYSRGMITSRSLERACRENITFMSQHDSSLCFVNGEGDRAIIHEGADDLRGRGFTRRHAFQPGRVEAILECGQGVERDVCGFEEETGSAGAKGEGDGE